MSMAPEGQGIWIAFPNNVEGGDFGKAGAKLANYGFKWVALVMSGASNMSTKRSQIKALAANGIKTYMWEYNKPGTELQQAGRVAKAIEIGASGYIADPETPYKGTMGATYAYKLCAAIRKVMPVGQYHFGYAPFALPGLHPDYPYKIFHEHCDSVHPQLYWTEFNHSPAQAWIDKFKDHWRVWEAANKVVIPNTPIGVTYGNGTRYGNPPGVLKGSDVCDMLGAFSSGPAMSWYSYEAAMPTFWESFWAEKQKGSLLST